MFLNLNDNSQVKAVVKLAYPDYTGRKIEVKFGVKTLDLRSFWSGGSRNYFKILRLSDNRIMEVTQNGTIFDSFSVESFAIPAGFIVVSHVIFCGVDCGIKIYSPESQLLESGSDSASDLTELDYRVLIVTASLKSSYAGVSDYRYYELKRKFNYTLSQVTASREKLISAGYLAKNKSITITGKNLIANRPDRYSL